MTLVEVWKKAKEGQRLIMRDSGTYPFTAIKKGTFSEFCSKELADAEVNILRDDWDIMVEPDKFRHTFESDYILGILKHFREELKTDKIEAQVLDKYACELTAYMNGKQALLRETVMNIVCDYFSEDNKQFPILKHMTNLRKALEDNGCSPRKL